MTNQVLVFVAVFVPHTSCVAVTVCGRFGIESGGGGGGGGVDSAVCIQWLLCSTHCAHNIVHAGKDSTEKKYFFCP